MTLVGPWCHQSLLCAYDCWQCHVVLITTEYGWPFALDSLEMLPRRVSLSLSWQYLFLGADHMLQILLKVTKHLLKVHLSASIPQVPCSSDPLNGVCIMNWSSLQVSLKPH